jgi:hypothetical protein
MSNRGRQNVTSPVANFTGPRSPQNRPREDTNSPPNVLQALEEVVTAQETISNQPSNPGLEEKVAQEFDKMNDFIRT